MYEDKRQIMRLSEDCWQCLKVIGDVQYANAYTFFWAQHLKEIQEIVRNSFPDIKEDWLSLCYEGNTLTFSISDEAINYYKPKIQEFSCFASAVRILGAYESYIDRIVEVSYREMPEEMSRFESNHNKINRNYRKSFWSEKLGRGIDFLSEVFGWNPQPHYKPALKLMFKLRNITVHNRGIADQHLCQLASNKYVHVTGTLKEGDTVSWNLGINILLHDLIIRILSEADRYVTPKLGLPLIEQRAFWHFDLIERMTDDD